MSTSNVPVFNKYLGNGVATQFSISFPYLKREYIKVYLYRAETDKEELLGSDRFEFVNDSTIEFPVIKADAILGEGDVLTVQRETTLGSEFEFDNQRRLFPVEVMNADDLSFQQIQELARDVARSVKVKPTANQTPEALLDTVYSKLDSATEVANQAINAANQATTAAESAQQAVEEAQQQVIETQQYVDEAKIDINETVLDAQNNIEETVTKAIDDVTGVRNDAVNTINTTVLSAKSEINTTIDDAQMSLSDTINQAVEDVKAEAVAAAEGAIQDAAATATAIVVDYTNNEIKPVLNEIASNAEADAANAAESAGLASNEADEAKHWAEDSRVWATGEDAEVEEIAPGEEEHSSRGYADLAMAIANTPEDVPVDTSTLLALQIIKGPKGDSSVGSFTGDNTINGTLNVIDDSNHPLKVTGMAGTSASGFQIVDSNGAGDSDFEHYATGDRYGTRITNKSTATGKSVNIDLYQTTAGKSVLDLSKPDTILAPALLDTLYPVGSIYITTTTTCPLEALGVGTWELVAEDRVLQGAGTRGAVGTTLEESLPNIKGEATKTNSALVSGAFYKGGTTTNSGYGSDSGAALLFDASLSSSTYKDGAPVQPDAYLVNIFRRTM